MLIYGSETFRTSKNWASMLFDCMPSMLARITMILCKKTSHAPSITHHIFRCALEKAGIYVVVALAHDCPTCAVTRDAAPDCYPVHLKVQGERVINEFSKYSNVLGFSAGNEVNHFAPPGQPQLNAACQKKFIRDMRAYIERCGRTNGMRHIPVGLVSADNDRDVLADYYTCGQDPLETAEWYGLNSYVACDGQAKNLSQAPGFVMLRDEMAAKHYSIPMLLTEFGCLSDTFRTEGGYEGQRDFRQSRWMLTDPGLRDTFNGGFAFEYSIEMENARGESPYPFRKFGKQNYGIGFFSPANCDDVKMPCSYVPLPSFHHLRQVYTKTTVDLATKETFTVDPDRQERPVCSDNFPPIASFSWLADESGSIWCPRRRQFRCSSRLGGAEEVLDDVLNSVESESEETEISLAVIIICCFTLCLLVYRKATSMTWLFDPSKGRLGLDEGDQLLRSEQSANYATFQTKDEDYDSALTPDGA